MPRFNWFHHLGGGASRLLYFAKSRQQFTNNLRPPRPVSTWINELDPNTFAAPTIDDLIARYLATRGYKDLAAKTKTVYVVHINRISEKFGKLPLTSFEERGARTVIRRWRDEVLSIQPSVADATIGMLRLLLNFAVDEEFIYRNPAAGLGKIHFITRRDVIWSDEQIQLFLEKAPRHLARVLLLALWTGQRQSDLLALRWESYDGEHFRLEQRKARKGAAGSRVKILISPEMKLVLEEIRAEQIKRAGHSDPLRRVPLPETILTTSSGYPWKTGFKITWRKAVDGAGISGVTFHDLRGTFITLSHRAGASIRDIAEATGHDERECERLIRHHYLATGGEQVISALSGDRSFASPQWIAAGPSRSMRKPRRKKLQPITDGSAPAVSARK